MFGADQCGQCGEVTRQQRLVFRLQKRREGACVLQLRFEQRQDVGVLFGKGRGGHGALVAYQFSSCHSKWLSRVAMASGSMTYRPSITAALIAATRP